MALSTWPSDILSLVIALLPINDLTQLKNTGDKRLIHRLLTQPILKSTTIESSNFPFCTLPSISVALSQLVIRLNVERNWTFDPSVLPASLTNVDFSFPTAQAIWLRKVNPGDFHWLFTCGETEFAPMSLCETLPKLKRLRLNGSENRLIWTQDGKQRILEWTERMKWLFYKNLPPTLESLGLIIDEESAKRIPFLPPSLTSFTNARGTGEFNVISLSQLIRPPNIASTRLVWDIFIRSFASDVQSFQDITWLDISGVAQDQWKSLPRRLTRLDISTGSFKLSCQTLCHLPRSLVHLNLLDVSFDESDPDVGHFCDFLPPKLTHLGIEIRSFRANLLDQIFADLRNNLSSLISLHLELKTLATERTEGLSWIPNSLRTLELLSPVYNRPTFWDKLLRQTSNENSPLTNITSLKLSCCQFPSPCHLPPHLTKLEVHPYVNIPISVLRTCPTTLTSLIVRSPERSWQDEQTPHTWTDSEILGLSLAPHFHLETDCFFSGVCTPIGATKLSLGAIRKWQHQFPSILRHCRYILNLNVLGTVPDTITSIEEHDTAVSTALSLWTLPNLTKMHIRSFRVFTSSNTSKDSHMLQNLKTLWIQEYSTTGWVEHFCLTSLQELQLGAGAGNILFLPDISHLTGLTTIHISSLKASNNVWKMLPPSVTSVTAPSLSHFWKLQHPKPRKNGPEMLPKFKLQRLCITGKDQSINQEGLSLLAPHLEHIDIPSISIEDGKTLYEGLPRDLCEITTLDLVKSICPSITSIGETVALAFPPTFLHKPTPKNLAIIEALPRTLTRYVATEWNPGWAQGLPPTLKHLRIDCAITAYCDDSGFPEEHPLSKLTSLTFSESVLCTSSLYKSLPRSLTELCMLQVSNMTASDFASLPPSLVTLKLPRLIYSDQLSKMASQDLRTLEIGFFCPSIADLPPTLTKLIILHLRFEQSQLDNLKPFLRLEHLLPSLDFRNQPSGDLRSTLAEAAIAALQSW